MFHIFDKINHDEVYVIAEMSANHGGKLENALEIVRQAANAACGTDTSFTICIRKREHLMNGIRRLKKSAKSADLIFSPHPLTKKQ